MKPADVTETLKPCPFCGNDGSGPIEDALHTSFHEAEWRHGDAWSVQCDKCTATMGYSKTKDEAIESWNTRATPVVKQSLTADVTDTLKRCHAARDGDCIWEQCPQLRDNEPASSGRHCPYDHWCYYCGEDESNGDHQC